MLSEYPDGTFFNILLAKKIILLYNYIRYIKICVTSEVLQMKKRYLFLSLMLILVAFSLSLTACNSNQPSEGDCSVKHTDADENGSCDICAANVIVNIDLYAINDLHGKFFDSESQPGVDEMTTYLKDAVKKNENTVIFSSGDMWQGSAESGLTHGKIMTEWMNDLDFEFMTLGNHEFDWGDQTINENLSLAEFPLLAINVYDSDTDRRADFCQPSVIKDLGELQIGFIGAIGDCYSSISADKSAGYYFVVGNELTELVKEESESLRAAGADIIVYSVHDSMDNYDITLSSGKYVDIVFEGHSHSKYVKLDKRNVYHLQGAGENRGMSHATIAYNIANDKKSIKKAEIIESATYSFTTDDDIVETLKNKYSTELAILEKDLGQNDTDRNSGYLTRLVADRYAALAAEKWAQYDVVLGGGYLSCRSPGKLSGGSVGYDDLYMLFPFDNTLALCSIKGSDLLERYINNDSYVVSYTRYGDSIKTAVELDKTYYIITDSYNYYYAPNNLAVVEVYDETTYARDLLADYIKNGGLTAGAPDPEKTLEPDKEYSIKELLEYTLSLPQGATTQSKFYVTGKIVSIENTTYGNCYIEDASGDRLYVYGLLKNGVRYDGMDQKPVVGDTVKLYGVLQHYVDRSGNVIPEMKNAEVQ